MKNIKIITLGLAALLSFGSCSDDDYTEKYENPAQTTNASCDKLMTGVFYGARKYIYNSYDRMYMWENGILGRYAQTIGFSNAESTLWSANDGYVNTRWANFYETLIQFRALQNKFENEDEKMQANDKIYIALGEVVVLDQLSQMVDAFGDVPFSEAGYLGLTGDVQGSFPSYDNAADLYKMMIERLGKLSSDINAYKANPSPLAAESLPKQDFINNGDLTKWVKYTNGLRLRLAMRVSSNGALKEQGIAAVKDVLAGGKAILAGSDEDIYVQPDLDGFNFVDNIRDGYKDHSRASQEMLNVLLTEDEVGQNDYRLPIMYSKNAAGEYKGMSTHEKLADQTHNIELPEAERVYSRIDSTTVIYNSHLMSPIVTKAEMDFLKAEAIERKMVSGDAKTAFVDGVMHSTQMYFAENEVSESTLGNHTAVAPSDADVRAYAAKLWDNADNKLEIIGAQKWLHFGFLQTSQAWSELRRTGYPELYYPKDPTAQLFKTLPHRVRYPASERNNNTEKYNEQLQKMGGKDDAYIKLFWAK